MKILLFRMRKTEQNMKFRFNLQTGSTSRVLRNVTWQEKSSMLRTARAHHRQMYLLYCCTKLLTELHTRWKCILRWMKSGIHHQGSWSDGKPICANPPERKPEAFFERQAVFDRKTETSFSERKTALCAPSISIRENPTGAFRQNGILSTDVPLLAEPQPSWITAEFLT